MDQITEEQIQNIASLLSTIHKIPVSEIDHISIPKYDFVNYFFPDIKMHTDLYESLTQLITRAEIKQDQFIHGDFHLENIVEHHGMYSIIDWTNGQLGDKRYNFAWALTLLKI